MTVGEKKATYTEDHIRKGALNVLPFPGVWSFSDYLEPEFNEIID